jgi:hypothetical protein
VGQAQVEAGRQELFAGNSLDCRRQAGAEQHLAYHSSSERILVLQLCPALFKCFGDFELIGAGTLAASAEEALP